MPPSDVTALSALADEFLTVCHTALGTTDAGAPTLYYVSPSKPVYDCCPALIVHAPSLSMEPTSPFSPPGTLGQRPRLGMVILATLVATALRCAPKPLKDGSVSTAAIEASAVEVQQDGWAMWNGITCAIRQETFKDLCAFVHFDRAVAIIEQGGCVGWEMTIRAQIDGIPCVPSS